MTLHLVKLAVGVNSVEHLAALQTARLAEARDAGRPPVLVHVTRQQPRDVAGLLDGGSIYWVIRGLIAVRQRLTAIEPVEGSDGIRRCALVLDPQLVEVETVARRPHQGWRYLKPDDAPPDRRAGSVEGGDPALAAELRALGLL